MRVPRPQRRNRSRVLITVAIALFIVSLVGLVLTALPGDLRAAFVYSIPKQQDQLTINEDGSVSLKRYFEFAVASTSSDSGNEIWAGLPTSRTTVSSVVDEDGKSVKFGTRSSGGEYVVNLSGFSIKPGSKKGFTITASIPQFVTKDSRNEGYVTMQYSPGWWTAPVAVQDIAVILPGKVEKSEIKTGSRLWDGISQLESGAYVVSWQFRDLGRDEKVSVNIGVPDKYMKLPAVVKPAEPALPPQQYVRPGPNLSSGFGVFAVFVIGLIAVAAAVNRNREEYSPPQVSMEGVGVNETLSPVEASVLLRQPPEKTLTLLLFSMVKKGYVRVTSQDPLKVAIVYERDLSEAERLYLEAVDRATGEVHGANLAPCFKYLAASVNEKMRPYCRKETEEFYRGVIRRAWDDVVSAETPEIRLSNMDRSMLWLMQDEERMQAAERELPRESGEREEVYPDWWMMGFLMGRPFGYPYYMWPGIVYGNYSGLSGSLLDSGDQAQFRSISEQIFSPATAKRPGRVGGGGGSAGHGGFTPPSCACACACVSCACACACAGGGGCT